jgi:hypothetical protein
MDMVDIVQFLKNEKRVGRSGLRCGEILSLDDAALERCHDYVQFLWPVPEKSHHNYNAPVLTQAVGEYLIETGLRGVPLMAWDRFKLFFRYGDWHIRQYWMQDGDHNLLRLTRIMRCLKLLKFDAEVTELYQELLKSNRAWGYAPQLTLDWWDKAATDTNWRPLR